MLQELGASTNASTWAVASMLFFVAVYLVVTVQVFRARPDELDARARMALDDTTADGDAAPLDGATQG